MRRGVARRILLRVYLPWSKKAERPGKFRFRRFFFITFVACFLPFAILTYIKIFARTVYPTIPFSLGGGQTRQVIFWLDMNTGPVDSFLERDGTKPYSVPYELLVESENSLVVISRKEDQQAIQFDRKSVGAMIVLGKRTGPAHFQVKVSEGESSH